MTWLILYLAVSAVFLAYHRGWERGERWTTDEWLRWSLAALLWPAFLVVAFAFARLAKIPDVMEDIHS